LLPQYTLDLGPDVEVCAGETASLNASGNFDSYVWTPAAYLSCSNCPNPQLTAEVDTSFILVAGTNSGCYSVDTISVNFLDTQLVYFDTSVCAGSFVVYNGQQLPPGSVTPFVFAGANGCDSTVVVQVAEAGGQGSFEQVDTAACAGSSIVYDGQAVLAGDSLFLNYTNVAGCDSVILVVVQALGADTTEESVQICQGDSIFIHGGWVFDEGDYAAVFPDVHGCDSTHVVHLSFFDPIQLGVNVQGSCPDQDNGSIEVTVFGGTAPFTYVWSNGSTGAKISDLPPGSYTVTVTDANGCQSVLTVSFEEYPLISYDYAWGDVSCHGEGDGWISIQSPDAGLTYSLNGGPFQSDTLFEGLSGGEYALTIQDANGCVYEENLSLSEPPPIVVSLPAEVSIDLGESTILNGEVFGQDTLIYTWTPVDGLDCPYCPEVVAQPLETTTYQLVVTDLNGCTATAYTLVQVNTNYSVFIPTAFSPNGDGLNDVFLLFGSTAVEEVLLFRIFDRWGDFVYEAYNFAPNMPEFGWDGTYRGKAADPGIYTYFASVRFVDGTEQVFKGQVHLVR
ncbi:MAG TPA: T9SS type B sorting domain-containing protein, partial [Phaeodactylibacter sp.]|nr:T9SS type B sorting domain-containing protein [Phaeodactylibacter sp.]